jgi:hypothetical protein
VNTTKRWKPVRRGPIYCSPRCGAGCTHKAFLAVTAKAAKTARRLGEGWSPVVYENMGWFWRVEFGDPSKYPHITVRGRGDEFEAEIQAGVYREPPITCGQVLQFWGAAATPHDALEAALAAVKETKATLHRAGNLAYESMQRPGASR